MSTVDRLPTLRSQMKYVDGFPKSEISFEIEEDAHEDDQGLLVLIRAMQYLLYHFPGGDTEAGSQEYALTALQVGYHNYSYELNPSERITFDHHALGPKVASLWQNITSGKVGVEFHDRSTDIERDQLRTRKSGKKRAAIGTLHLPRSIDRHFEEHPLEVISYVAGSAHIFHVLEQASAGNWDPRLDALDDIESISILNLSALKHDLMAHKAAIDFVFGKSVSVSACRRFLDRLETFTFIQN